jgi:hypothetical protein
MKDLLYGKVFEGDQLIADVRYWIGHARSTPMRGMPSIPTISLIIEGLLPGFDGCHLTLIMADDGELPFTMWAGEAKPEGEPRY